MHDAILEFFGALERHPFLDRAKIIYIGESNTGHVSGNVAHMLRDHSRVRCFRDKAEGNPGVWTSAQRRDDYLNCLIDCVENTKIRFMDGFIVVNCKPEDADELRAKNKTSLLTQAGRARRVVKFSKPGVASHVFWDAKHNEKGQLVKEWTDDLLDSFVIAVCNALLVLKRDPRYCPPEWFE